MLLANNRIEIDARPQPSAPPALEVVMLGHCPGAAQWQRLARDELLLNDIAALGFTRECERLRALGNGAAFSAEDARLLALYDLPIPLHSLGQYQALFPEAFEKNTQYESALARSYAWLPLAVQDFFASSGGENRLKLWIIRVDEAQRQQGFLPKADAQMNTPETLGAFERALLITNAGVIALPDLERLQIPSRIDNSKLRVKNSEPAFLPCGSETDDGINERYLGQAMPAPLPTAQIVVPIIRAIAQYRPDMQCLLSVALDTLPASEQAGPAPEFLDCIAHLAGINADSTQKDKRDVAAEINAQNDVAENPANAHVIAQRIEDTYTNLLRSRQACRHLQLIYPYLRGSDRKLSSAIGLVTGMQARVSQQYGPWRSIGEHPLPGRSLPWPAVNQQQATALRNAPGVTVLLHRANRIVVDDERMCTPCLPNVQLLQLTSERRNDDHWRSAEIMRFMGWLQRQLQALGEQMIFNTDVRDPRPLAALKLFFTRLYTLGALRGRKVEDAFTLTQRFDGDNTFIFDIEIAPAYPIDQLRLTFMQDRNSGGMRASIESASEAGND